MAEIEKTTRTAPEPAGGYYQSKYSGEEMDALLDKVAALPAAAWAQLLAMK